jgi:VWFA-related protein
MDGAHRASLIRGAAVLTAAFAVVADIAGVYGPPVAIAQDQPPRFQSGVEVVTVDVTVVDGNGRPVLQLTPADFIVEVDGRRRRVITAEWIPLTFDSAQGNPAEARTPSTSPAAQPALLPYSSNERPTGGRLIVLFVDRLNIRFEGLVAMRSAVEGFLDRLQPSDRVALVVDGFGTANTLAFTTDRQRIKDAIGRIAGQRGLVAGSGAPNHALRELLTGLKSIDAPKTVLLISEGFPVSDAPLLAATRPFLVELEQLAAESRTIIYSLKLDPRLSDLRWQTQDTALGPDLTAPAAGDRRGAARSQGTPDLGDQRSMPGPANAAVPDRIEAGAGLYSVAAVTGGSMFTIVMNADPAFARIDAELSGYYLLGVEADLSHRDGKPRAIKVDVARSGVTVRSRRQLIANRPAPRPKTPDEALLPAFSSPTPIAALPIRVATFAMRGNGASDIRLMIHAEVGADYTAQKTVVLGFVIADATDTVIERRAGNSTLRPVSASGPSPLQVTTSVSLPPGEYTMKLAVADGDRVGSVEHRVRAAIDRAGAVSFSDLVVGGTAASKPAMPPPIAPTVRADFVQGVIEAYGAEAVRVRGRLEIAARETGPALAEAPIMAVAAGDGRAILVQVLPVRDLQAGRYVLRATLEAPNAKPLTIARAFQKE